jgi:hypothetical protein
MVPQTHKQLLSYLQMVFKNILTAYELIKFENVSTEATLHLSQSRPQ